LGLLKITASPRYRVPPLVGVEEVPLEVARLAHDRQTHSLSSSNSALARHTATRRSRTMIPTTPSTLPQQAGPRSLVTGFDVKVAPKRIYRSQRLVSDFGKPDPRVSSEHA
jgi:hypothetical protein